MRMSASIADRLYFIKDAVVLKGHQPAEFRTRHNGYPGGGTMRNAAAIGLLAACWAGLSPGGSDTREAFLNLIGRPRVPLAPAAENLNLPGGLLQVNFSFAAEEGERVPGVLLRQATGGRRPAVVALHGTGGNKEGQIPLLRQLAGK